MGRAATGRKQPREKISHFNEVTTNKTNNNDLCSSRYSSLHTAGHVSACELRISGNEKGGE